MKNLIAVLSTILFSVASYAAPSLTYHGRLLNSAGIAVTSSVQFKIQIRSPGNEDCLMYEETQTQDLSTTAGVFALAINSPFSTRTDGGTTTFGQIFANRVAFNFGFGKCMVGTSYTPTAVDGRNMRVSFNDGSFGGWEDTPLQALNFVPQAIDAMQVGGFTSASLLRVENGSGPQTATALTPANFTELLALINGTSTQFTKADGSGFAPAAAVSFNSQKITNVAAPSASTDAVNKAYADGYIGGKAVDTTIGSLAAGDAGKALTWNGTKWVVATAVSNSTALVGDVSGTLGATVVDTVGAKTSAQIAQSVSDTLAATNANTASTIVKRDASGNVAATNLSVTSVSAQNNYLYDNTNTNYVILKAPVTGITSYTFTLPPVIGTANQMIGYNAAGTALENKSITAGTGITLTQSAGGLQIASAAGTGTVTSVTSANADIGVATTTTTPVLTLNSGTGADQIVKLDGSAKLPAVDGSALTNISRVTSVTSANSYLTVATTTTTPVITAVVGSAANTLAAGNDTRITGAVQQTAYNGDIANVLDSNCGVGSTPKWNVATDMWTCVAIGSLDAGAITTGTIAAALLPASATFWNDAGSGKINYNGGNVGLGTASPRTQLHVNTTSAAGLTYATFLQNPNSTVGAAVGLLFKADADNSGLLYGKGAIIFQRTGGTGFGDMHFALNTTATGVNATAADAKLTILSTGNVGIGTTAPTAALTLKAGTATASTAPLKLTSGTVLTTPEAGAVEYDGTNFYFTDSTATRRTLASASGTNNSYSGVTTISNSGGNITLSPATSTGAVLINSGTASTGSSNGALVVTGGIGTSGDIYSAASINAATTMSALTSILTPQLYGSAAASGNIKIDGSSNATKGNVLLASAGGKVGVGSSTAPTSTLEVTSALSTAFAVGPNASTNPAFGIDASATSSATGIKLSSAAATGGVLLQATSSGSDENVTLAAKGNANVLLSSGATGGVGFSFNGTQTSSISATGANFSTTTSNNGTLARFKFTGASDTNVSSGVEAQQVVFNMGQTRQHGSNTAISLQRDFRIIPNTHSFGSSGGVITNAATFAIDGPAQGSTNGTLTNSSAIYIPALAVTNVTNSFGLNITATTGATNNYAAIFNGGNVGVGTSSPTATLDVYGSAATFTRAAPAGAGQNAAAQFGISGNGTTAGTGPSMLFFGDNSGAAKNYMGRLSAVWENATAGSEQAALVWSVRANSADTTATTERMRVSASGSVGIGTSTPGSKLSVAGAINSVPNAPTAAAVDLSLSNTQVLAAPGGATITLSNMVHGGSYTLLVTDTTSRTYTFSGCTTSKFKPGNAATTTGTPTIYTILTIYNGTNYDCYINWATGYQ